MSARARTSLALFAAFGLLAAPAAVAADGKAEGSITVNGKTTKLAHAYARAVKGFFDKTKEDVHVLLTDAALSPKALEDVFERIHLADAGKLHAIELVLDADAKPISTSLLHDAFKAAPSGMSSSDVFEKKTFDGKTAAGRFVATAPHEFMGVAYSYDVTFSAPIVRKARPAPPSAADTAAAAASPQAKAYQQYLKALKAGDIPALKKLVSGEMAKGLSGPEAAQAIPMIQAMMPADIKVVKLEGKGGEAKLSVRGTQDKQPAFGTVDMILEGGQWKVQKESWSNKE